MSILQLQALLSLPIQHKNEILKCLSLKDAHIYCKVNNLSGQVSGPLLENYIKEKFNYTKVNASECKGDCEKGKEFTEIKCSLGGKEHNKFNWVQIRPNHKLDNYVLTAYHLSNENVENRGELFIFRLTKSEMADILSTDGGYAHGSITKHGKITLESILDPMNEKEYALRPKYGTELFKKFSKYRIQEEEL